jgi:murein DD-endopeptidase MepM/ murein hydrolase activator NlpD
MRSLTILFAVYLSTLASSVLAQSFLVSPLECGDSSCNFKYDQGVYTSGVINSVLDHSLKQNANGMWQFGTTVSGGGDGIVVAFNGERAAGAIIQKNCVGGSILLKPTPSSPANSAMTNTRGCPAGYASYDEHPGYDYRAAMGTIVRAAAAGTVVNIAGKPCINTNLPAACDSGFGYVGIDHGNGYISQYGHMAYPSKVRAGQKVVAGEIIGLSGDTGVAGAPHLHFEVLKVKDTTYLVVDPYGWVGPSGADPLYSATAAPPAKLWK